VKEPFLRQLAAAISGAWSKKIVTFSHIVCPVAGDTQNDHTKMPHSGLEALLLFAFGFMCFG